MERRIRLALGILILLLMSPWSSMVEPGSEESDSLEAERDVEFFSIRTDAYSDFVGTYDSSNVQEQRTVEAHSRLGTYSIDGLELNRPLSNDVLEPRFDAQLLLINNDRNMLDVRKDLADPWIGGSRVCRSFRVDCSRNLDCVPGCANCSKCRCPVGCAPRDVP